MVYTAEQLTAQCAWCGKIIRVGVKGAPITHTICPECETKLMEDVDDHKAE
jgi:hypothetical protein